MRPTLEEFINQMGYIDVLDDYNKFLYEKRLVDEIINQKYFVVRRMGELEYIRVLSYESFDKKYGTSLKCEVSKLCPEGYVIRSYTQHQMIDRQPITQKEYEKYIDECKKLHKSAVISYLRNKSGTVLKIKNHEENFILGKIGTAYGDDLIAYGRFVGSLEIESLINIKDIIL